MCFWQCVSMIAHLNYLRTNLTPAFQPTAQQLPLELPAVQQVALRELGKGSAITDADVERRT